MRPPLRLTLPEMVDAVRAGARQCNCCRRGRTERPAVYSQRKPLRDSLKSGYRIELQGAVEESANSQTSINAKMPAMVLVIVLLLMVQLLNQKPGYKDPALNFVI